MTWFKDLDLLDYHGGPFAAENWAVPLRAIGWLESPHPFDAGEAPAAFIERFRTLVAQTAQTFVHYSFRGLHECDRCASMPPLLDSHVNLFVPGEGVVFCATAALLHYVEAHGYRPPSVFIDAVMACPDVSSPAFLEALRHANAGVEPPLEEWRRE